VVTASYDRGQTWSKTVTATPDDAMTYFQPNLAVNVSGDEIWQQSIAYLLMVHGGVAMITLLLLGALVPLHLLRAWRSGKNRISGSLMATFNAVLIATAFGLYYLGSESLRPWMSWTHIVAGFSLAVWFPFHIYWGRRKLR